MPVLSRLNLPVRDRLMHRRVWMPAFFALCLSLAFWSGSAQAQSLPTEKRNYLAPTSAFAERAELWNVVLSPSGRSLLTIEAGGETAQLVISSPRGTSNLTRLEAPFGSYRWARWLNDERIIASIDYNVSIGSYRESFRRYVAVDPDGSNLIVLGRSRFDLRRPGQGGDRLVSFLNGDDDHVLISARRGRTTTRQSVYRANIWSGKTEKIQSGRRNIETWIADQNGKLRLGFGYKGTEALIHLQREGSTSWDLAYRFDVFQDPVFVPLAFANDGKLFVLSTHESDRKSLYKFDLATGRFGGRIFQHPRYDLSGVVLGGDTRDLLGASLSGGVGDVVYLDEERLGFNRQLEALLGTDRFQVSSVDDDGTLATVFVAGSNDPGRYMLVDLKKEQVTLLANVLPSLASLAMPEMQQIEYRARDGLRIEGYLTKPVRTMGAPLPLVVMPHGGPGIRETDAFNPFTQFLVNRGYAVLQMNFRGSAGFGRRHLQSGYRQWGLDIQNDIEDGTRWVMAQPDIDSDRICIFGGSFGGYASLMGVVTSPNLYRCAVSLNGVSDIPLMLRNRQKLSTRDVLPVTIGDLYRERDALRARSPLYNIDRIRSPILLAHGLDDTIVSPQHSKRMAKKLKAAGLPHQTVYFEDGTHDLTDPPLRTRFLENLEAFLETHLSPKIN